VANQGAARNFSDPGGIIPHLSWQQKKTKNHIFFEKKGECNI
jgi:hypothetical protein